jgi:GNAT acetyltransferase
MRELDEHERREAADHLPDIPQNCIARHALRSGRGRAFSLEGMAPRDVLVIDPSVTPAELLAFGDDHAAIARLLGRMRGWKVVEVPQAVADDIAAQLAAELDTTIDQFCDLFFTLNAPATVFDHPSVRELTREDVDLYMRSAPSLNRHPDEAKLTLLEGPVVAAVIDNLVACTVELNVRTEKHANFTVETVPDCRKQGLCSATASFAARVAQSMGLIPVWSCSDRNLASQRVAQKVGFQPVPHCVYLAPRR